ncbi:AraC family transcriptional regulator [Cryptosporangium arvum]|uniref:DNA-binding domain-containing protein, AraC-type n=1 Tax=Cryptosporangium arvum DSM 44712 TaxID=927661 RepID=A0A011AJY7_9ACTN|nr:AraC family transcriptional regulator [Cryptosporangium arvum]EXG82276.1 DNA-binding domain-containing protein, AraC-type [Cryptosporangium arvum DSM 44712]
MSLEALTAGIERHAQTRGVSTAVPGLVLAREDREVQDIDLAYRPMLCFVAQGAKRTVAGRRATRVARGEVFLSLLDVPVVATYEVPFRSATLDIDDEKLAQVISQRHTVSPVPVQRPTEGFAVAAMDQGLVGAVDRWVGLLDEPHHRDVLAPLLEYEILHRALSSPLGPALRAAVSTGPVRAIREAAAELRDHYARTIPIHELARAAGMSPATFYRHFRAVTGLSPNQLQRITRLQNSRRLLAAGKPVTTTAQAVGYASASQFSRDYRLQYGRSPAADARIMRADPPD